MEFSLENEGKKEISGVGGRGRKPKKIPTLDNCYCVTLFQIIRDYSPLRTSSMWCLTLQSTVVFQSSLWKIVLKFPWKWKKKCIFSHGDYSKTANIFFSCGLTPTKNNKNISICTKTKALASCNPKNNFWKVISKWNRVVRKVIFKALMFTVPKWCNMDTPKSTG